MECLQRQVSKRLKKGEKPSLRANDISLSKLTALLAVSIKYTEYSLSCSHPESSSLVTLNAERSQSNLPSNQVCLS
jgi:hypothetical protein